MCLPNCAVVGVWYLTSLLRHVARLISNRAVGLAPGECGAVLAVEWAQREGRGGGAVDRGGSGDRAV